MNGPEHFREAERLVAHSQDHTDQGNFADDAIAALAAAQAQVHATLALVAVTANSSHYEGDYARSPLVDPPGNDWKIPDALEWAEVLR